MHIWFLILVRPVNKSEVPHKADSDENAQKGYDGASICTYRRGGVRTNCSCEIFSTRIKSGSCCGRGEQYCALSFLVKKYFSTLENYV